MKNITIISIPVTDQTRSKEFYMQLGFQLLIEAPFGGGSNWVQLGLPGAETTITLTTWFDSMPAGCIRGLVVSTDDLDGEIKALNEKGIEVGEIDQTPWGRFAAVKDPDGNTISLHQE